MGTMLTSRNDPVMLDVKRSVEGGALGDIMAVEARQVTSQVRYRDPSFWLFDKAKAGSGILSWLGCHQIDALCYLLGDSIESVAAMVATKNPFPIDVEDTACSCSVLQRGNRNASRRIPPRGSESGTPARDTTPSWMAGDGRLYTDPALRTGWLRLNSIAEGWVRGVVATTHSSRPTRRLTEGGRRGIRSSVSDRIRNRCVCNRPDRSYGPCARSNRGGHRVIRDRKDCFGRLGGILDLQLYVTQRQCLVLHDRPHDRAYFYLVPALPERWALDLVFDHAAFVFNLG